ncbi:MAG: substrate-binding domain-containing protein [Spirochaetia bacterium]|jgi:ribose transport system substrate-binding protein
MKKTLLLLIALVLLICIPATFAAAQAKQVRIGYITRLSVPWWIVCDKGFQDAANKFGFKPVIYDPPQLTVEDQVRVMESWIAAGIDAVLIGPNDPAAPIGVINEAIEAGIPVICGYGVDSPTSKRLLFEGYDAGQLGVALGKGLLASLKLAGKTSGKVTYHTGGMVSTEDVASYNGFKSVVQAAGFTVVEPVLDGGDPAKAMSLARETIDLYPDLVGMLGYYDYTGPALGKAVTDANKVGQIVVQADGLIGEMVPYMKSGAISATIDLVQYDGSYRAAEILYKLVKAGKSGWDRVLKQYKASYPADKNDLQGFGWVTYNKVNVPKWPEIAWMMTIADHQKRYPEVWKIIAK